ncbi:hypothetical protein K438DRAFT_761539 [Mycena galopus ATCC 62051]|nr:hypothetical protein K438DRAFT_761539 [Mycena galopus ATCC 62051]
MGSPPKTSPSSLSSTDSSHAHVSGHHTSPSSLSSTDSSHAHVSGHTSPSSVNSECHGFLARLRTCDVAAQRPPRPPGTPPRPRPRPYPETRPPLKDANVEAFVAALTRKYPHITESLCTQTGLAEAIAAVSICAEQTFTESAATRKEMGPACSVALDAYVGSDLERDMKNEIARIPPKDDWHAKLVEIIITHRLRISHSLHSGAKSAEARPRRLGIGRSNPSRQSLPTFVDLADSPVEGICGSSRGR